MECEFWFDFLTANWFEVVLIYYYMHTGRFESDIGYW